ncbi:hypothetical protein BGZ83_003333 [Gryganskiella cystojenkinii]|nr:hypothetical protein BGZ83_003333 [Gryganskiella cystojenkinii]
MEAHEDKPMSEMDPDQDYSNVRVYTRHLQPPSAIHQACVVHWTRRPKDVAENPNEPKIDIVLGKGTFLSLHRLVVEVDDETRRPMGSLELVHEQSVFGKIRDLKSLNCKFELEDGDDAMDVDQRENTENKPVPDRPRYGYLPKSASPNVLVATSDSGMLSFFTFQFDDKSCQRGNFYLLKEARIAEPGFNYKEAGAKIAIDPTYRMMAVSALQNHIQIVVLRSTTRSQFDPVDRVAGIDLDGTIISMDFLTADPYDPEDVEEKITLVTVEKPPRGVDTSRSLKHHHRYSLPLEKRELSEEEKINGISTYPLISACSTPPPSGVALSDQTLYLGSDTAELYRVNVSHLTYTMAFELISGDRPIGEVLTVLARDHLPTERLMGDLNEEITLNTDYLLYSNDQGDGRILAIREEEDDIELFDICDLPNSSPILDFCAREPSLPGRDALYVCSGMKDEGSIKRIRSGITVESTGSSGDNFFAGTTGLWSVKASTADSFDSYIVTSFIQQTKIMQSGQEAGLEDVSEDFGFDLTVGTLDAGRLKDGIFYQVHRGGVIAVQPGTGVKYTWQSGESIVASACWVNEGILLVGQISAGFSSLVLLELGSLPGEPTSLGFKVVTTLSLSAEPTTIHCWHLDTPERGILQFCCVGSLEPGILICQITTEQILDIYSESLAEAGLENVTIPHSVCMLTNSSTLQRKLMVGLRDGSIIAYDWRTPTYASDGNVMATEAVLLKPTLFKLGVLPVRCTLASYGQCSKALVFSDKLWQTELKDNDLDVQRVLFDYEVSQASAFHTGDRDQSSHPCFVCIVEHDLQMITLQRPSQYNYQTLNLGQTPRRILDVTSKRLLMVATVGEGFPFAETTLQLVDPERASRDPELDRQHIVCEVNLKQGEAVFSMAEWKVPRPGKSDAVYICIGTGLFSPTGNEISAASPKLGRLVVFSVKQAKKGDRKFRKVEMELRWAMAMPAPVFAISPFKDMKLLISNGPILKLLGLDMEKKTLVEKASYRERWPIFQISNSGSMICTGSRREAICFYEYQPGAGGERSFDKLRFIKSAGAMRMVSDCIALSPDFAVGVDLSGEIFGIGYSLDDPNCQHSLVDRFSIHVGEVINRIRIAKLWPVNERSLRGIALSQQQLSDNERGRGDTSLGATKTNQPHLSSSSSSRVNLEHWILLPWTPSPIDPLSSQLTQIHSSIARTAPQALIGCSLVGSIIGFWRLRPSIYLILHVLQSVMQATYECRPLLGNDHDRFRSKPSLSSTIDGNLMQRFLNLDHAVQIALVSEAVGLDRMVEECLQQSGMIETERESLKSTGYRGEYCLEHRDRSGPKGAECNTVHVLSHILGCLQSLNWHQ